MARRRRRPHRRKARLRLPLGRRAWRWNTTGLGVWILFTVGFGYLDASWNHHALAAFLFGTVWVLSVLVIPVFLDLPGSELARTAPAVAVGASLAVAVSALAFVLGWWAGPALLLLPAMAFVLPKLERRRHDHKK